MFLAILLSGLVAPASRAWGQLVTLYGRPGTFGTSGFATVGVPNWHLDAGLAPFFTAVTSDGTFFEATMTQTFRELGVTSCEMVIACFNESAPVCKDTETGVA